MPPAVVLRIDKSGLDDAHKDKHHKLYSADFKVSPFQFLFNLKDRDVVCFCTKKKKKNARQSSVLPVPSPNNSPHPFNRKQSH